MDVGVQVVTPFEAGLGAEFGVEKKLLGIPIRVINAK